MKTVASSRRRRAPLLTAVAAAGLVLTACNPLTTTLSYAPADGVEMDGSTLVARDVLVVSQGGGAPGVLVGTLVNQGDEPQTVSVSVAGQQVGEVTVEPRSAARLDGVSLEDGSDGSRTTVDAVEARAGEHVEVRLQSGSDTLSANAPVLLPHGSYAHFADDAGGTVEPHPQDESADH